jgi:hypothetical protein
LIFNGNDASFVSGGLYLGTQSTEEYTPLERMPSIPSGFRTWSFAGIFAQLEGTAGFCLDQDGLISAFTVPQLRDNIISLVNNRKSISRRLHYVLTEFSSVDVNQY